MKIVETITHYRKQEACKTAAQMEEICCESTGELQCCEEVEKDWSGYSAEDVAEELGLTLDSDGWESPGHYVKISFIARKNPCGEQLTKCDTSGKNCCDEVEPLVWDSEESAEVVADMSSAVVAVTGGRPPFKVTVRGNGFYLDTQNSREGYVDSGNIRIYTSLACGPATITITDGCTTVTGVIRSDNGQWYEVHRNVGGGAQGFSGGCPVMFEDVTNDEYEISRWFEGISGKWKMQQAYARLQSYDYAARRPNDNAMSWCLEQENERYPPGVSEGALIGSCWTFEQECMGCDNDCWENPLKYRFSYDVGYHAYVTKDCTATDGWCTVVGGWSLVNYTIIWEWRC
ncbi:MAG: hypothetical protein ACI8PB_002907 [Desulforhopalus sp.]|jgi:hypothetical protein